MKVLLLNGSANKNGNTYTALQEVATTLEKNGIATEIAHLGNKAVRECIGCRKCKELGSCIFDDDVVPQLIEKAKGCDGFIFGSPVYYAHPTGAIQAALDRMFYSQGSIFTHKPGAAIVVARRGGTTASLDVLNKYFSINQMPIVGSTYWNLAHGGAQGEVLHDLEGMQTMRNLGQNMAWLLKCIEAGKAVNINPPIAQRDHVTNFIR